MGTRKEERRKDRKEGGEGGSARDSKKDIEEVKIKAKRRE